MSKNLRQRRQAERDYSNELFNTQAGHEAGVFIVSKKRVLIAHQIVLTSASSCCPKLCTAYPKLLSACATLHRFLPHLGSAITGSYRCFTDCFS